MPLKGISPIVVAALPIGEKLNVSELSPFSETIIRGLIGQGVHVVSACADGTTTERNIQRQILRNADMRRTYSLRSPTTLNEAYTLRVDVAIIQGCPIVLIQDSLHGRKTFRNNLFSGARLLVFGNFTALYRFIRSIAFDSEGTLYIRDVERLDRQDDNASARLNAALTLRFCIEKHPRQLGEILYLFIFGELIDAYQNRAMCHSDRLRLLLRAHYFIKMWRIFLARAGYSETLFFISREAADIADFLIKGLYGLIIVYRDHYSHDKPFPLLPWLHSTEACEHTFGEARKIIPDFTAADFYQILGKITIKIRAAVSLAEMSADPRQRASGYNITYMDQRDIDLVALATYPSDIEIEGISKIAFEEAESLVNLLGVVPGQLHSVGTETLTSVLPSIDDNDLAEDLEEDDDGLLDIFEEEEEESDASILRSFIITENSRTDKLSPDLVGLSMATLSLMLEDVHMLSSVPDIDDDVLDALYAEEADLIHSMLDPGDGPFSSFDAQPEKPFGKGTASYEDLDLTYLHEERAQHETRQEAEGTRRGTKSTLPAETTISSPPSTSTKAGYRALAERLHTISRDQHDNRGVTTGRDRQVRWMEADKNAQEVQAKETGAAGNAANAAGAARAVAGKAMKKRAAVFLKASVPAVNTLKTARVSALRPLKIGDFGIVYTPGAYSGVAIACGA